MQVTPSRFQTRNAQSAGITGSILNGREIVSLTDKERDEIDFETKTIIRQTMDRVKTMENLEKGLH